jgi:hypothetical protein
VEIGFGQANDIARLLDEQPHLSLVHIQTDLQQIPRAVVACATSSSRPAEAGAGSAADRN